MKLFDTREIANEKTLTPEQVKYLKEPSITFVAPFNILVRQHWDLLVTGIVVSIVLNLGSIFLLAHYIPETDLNALATGHSSPYLFLILGAKIPGYIFTLFILCFGVKHGRRLSWNRNPWNSFDDFKKSEDKWTPWGWFSAIFITLSLISMV